MTSYTVGLLLAALAGALLPAPARRSRRGRSSRGSPGPPVSLARAAAACLGRRWPGSSRRAEEALRAQIMELLDALSGELRGGASPAAALVVAAEGLPALSSLRAAAPSAGHDRVDLLRSIGARPGGSAARRLAVIWAVAESSGCALALPVARLAMGERQTNEVRREVSAQLAGPRATSRLLLVLPVLALLLGVGLGADPVTFLGRTPAGQLCLVAGVALLVAGSRWTTRILRDVESSLP